MIIAITVGVFAYALIIILLLCIVGSAKGADEAQLIQQNSKLKIKLDDMTALHHKLLDEIAVLHQLNPSGATAVGEFGFPMPSTTQPDSVNPVAGYDNQRFERVTWDPREVVEPKRKSAWAISEPQDFGMGV